MDREQLRSRLDEDLRGIVAGEVLCDAESRSLYATDASLCEVWPLAVVRPRTSDDVAATVRWAAEHQVPVHPRGAGTSLAGGSLGPGIVIDCGRFFRRILRTGGDEVHVQSGVVAAQLEEHLARTGRSLGVDPTNRWVTTIGGLIGRNSSGSRFPRHGGMSGRLESARVVLADGAIVDLEPTAPASPHQPALRDGDASPFPDTATAGTAARLTRLASGVAEILGASRAQIAASQPSTRATHGGYQLHDLVRSLDRDGLVDLPRLLCGAEGTLGIVTEATLRTVPDDAATAVGLFLFDSLDQAATAALALRPLAPDACDLFDKRHLTLARTARPAFEELIPPVAAAGLLVEFSAADDQAAAARFDEAARRLQGPRALCIDVRRAEGNAEKAALWELSRSVVATLHGVRGTVRPVPFVEDVVVPPEAVPAFVRRLQEVLKECDLTAMLFAHASHGQLHIRPYIDPRDPAERLRLERLADAIYGEVVAVGGTIGGEQGLGLSRTPFFTSHFAAIAGLFTDVKRVFDPQGVLNPGLVSGASLDGVAWRPPLGLPPPPPTTQPAAPSAAVPAFAPLPLPLLNWTAEQLSDEVDACNGCGGCRTQSPSSRMCPLYRENPAEETSPRAKANLMAALLSTRLDPTSLGQDTVRAIADTCFNCHQCRADCPAGVDIPAIVTELKAAHVEINGLDPQSWLLSRVDLLSSLGGAVAPLANRAIANPQARWLMEKVLGVARGRKLPPFTGQQVMRWAARRGLTRPSRRSGPRVLYFLDTFARFHDPLLVKALVAVLEHNGIGVFIDPRQVSAGMPLVAAGDVAAARRLASTNLRVLAEAVRLGYRIICTEPSAVTCIVHDYPLLLEDDEMERVVAATSDAATFLWDLHREGRLRLDLQPLSTLQQPAPRILYHAPCHARIGRDTSPAEHLLRLLPGLTLDSADRGCSGMAGTFGLSRVNYRTSLRVGLGLVSAMRSGGIEAGATECSGCRIQMEQGTSKPTVHPLKLLAKSYGLLTGPGPDGLDSLLSGRSGSLTTS
jgi:FAD/FMN-containing dehydrogenase/Fe-S oxidoreductase